MMKSLWRIAILLLVALFMAACNNQDEIAYEDDVAEHEAIEDDVAEHESIAEDDDTERDAAEYGNAKPPYDLDFIMLVSADGADAVSLRVGDEILGLVLDEIYFSSIFTRDDGTMHHEAAARFQGEITVRGDLILWDPGRFYFHAFNVHEDYAHLFPVLYGDMRNLWLALNHVPITMDSDDALLQALGFEDFTIENNAGTWFHDLTIRIRDYTIVLYGAGIANLAVLDEVIWHQFVYADAQPFAERFQPKSVIFYMESTPLHARLHPLVQIFEQGEGLASFVVFVDTWRYQVEQQPNLIRLTSAHEMPEGWPAVYMEIIQLSNTTVAEKEHAILSEIYSNDVYMYFHSQPWDDFPFAGFVIYRDGFDGNAPVQSIFIKDNGNDGVFVIRTHSSVVGTTGHGVRFRSFIDTLRLIDSE